MLEIDESPVVISTRSLKPVYNVETLIRAIPLILAEIPQAKFVVAGAGEQEKYLKELARDLSAMHTLLVHVREWCRSSKTGPGKAHPP